MRSRNCRGLRLELVAGLLIAVAMPAMAAEFPTTTTLLTAGPLMADKCSQPLSITVTSGGQPVSGGIVTINDDFNGNAVQLASMALTDGAVSPTVALAEGSHSLTAVFTGASYQSSTSAPVTVSNVTTQCEFTIALSNFSSNGTASPTNTLTLTPGQAGTATVTITPSVEFTSTLTAPMFVTISCSGLPDVTSCAFTPENLEILSTTPESCGGSPVSCPPTSTLVLQTFAATSKSSLPANRRPNPVSWALLLPGVLGLGGLAFGVRRRLWLSRLSLMLLIGLITLLGATACNPRYGYLNHSPPANLPTPAGTYTVTVTAQFSNNVTSVQHSTTFVLTVN
ncbi:MAG: Ig-like domain-containing protein [Terracidiphilus sp.]